MKIFNLPFQCGKRATKHGPAPTLIIIRFKSVSKMRISLVLASALAVVQLGFGFVGTFHFGVSWGPSDEPYRTGCLCKMRR
jgi:hypothetical protein